MKTACLLLLALVPLTSALLSDDELRDQVVERSSRIRRACITNTAGGVAGSAAKFAVMLGKRALSGCIGGGIGGTSSGSRWADSCMYQRPGRPLPGVMPGGSTTLGKRDLSDFKKPNRDFIFVLDTSGSIPDQEFEKAKESIAIMIRSFCPHKLGENTKKGTKQVAVVLFDQSATTDISYEESHIGINHLVKKVISLKHRRGSTATANALQHVLKNVLYSADSRLKDNDTSAHVIVITDGRCNTACQTLAKDADNIRKAGPRGVQLFALGIGNARDCELEIITGKGQDMAFQMSNFQEFQKFALAVKENADENPDKCI